MKASSNSPIVKHLVLIGGGHSHLSVLKRLGMKPVPGLAVTLISRDIDTPYSGSLPGHITGLYDLDEIHIDLRPLAQFAGVRIIQQEIEAIDLSARSIGLTGRPDIEFDLLSLNIGSKPDAVKIPGAMEHAIGVKPIDLFLERWQEIRRQALGEIQQNSKQFTLAIVGGGPASVELAFAAQQRIRKDLEIKPKQPLPFQVKIISADDGLLKFHNNRARKFIADELARRNIDVLLNHRVTEFKSGTVLCEQQESISADAIVFATGASIPQWPLQAGLTCSEDGFIEVNNFLQTSSHEFVFAAGDAATIKGAPRPKSGVYAVRQGKVLAENLVRYATGKKLKRYTPQQHALALINLGNKQAIASRRNLFLKGRSIWALKHNIDSKFLRKYSELPEISMPLDLAAGLVDKETERQLKNHAMRCAGCGAKVASNILEEVLQQLPQTSFDVEGERLPVNSQVEDAAQIPLADGRVLLQSVDQIKALVNDPWLFARIATNHCLSDIYAMGAMPHSALAIVGLPFAGKDYARSQLKELMLSCTETLQENNCALIGGHTAESSDLIFGLCVNGFAEQDALLGKQGMQNGDIVILCKPLGTGTLLAADMRYRARHVWMKQALQTMALSNRAAAECFVQHKASACTDITGFGLAGHLMEMLTANNIELELSLGDLPALPGALECLQNGILSSLHSDNALVSRDIHNAEAFSNQARYDLLFDPQTAGGLLASVPEISAEACLQQLRDNGYHHAKAIGQVAQIAAERPAIILK